MWKCSCGTENDYKYCVNCGKPMPEQSRTWMCACGTANGVDNDYCSGCGRKRGGAPAAPGGQGPDKKKYIFILVTLVLIIIICIADLIKTDPSRTKPEPSPSPSAAVETAAPSTAPAPTVSPVAVVTTPSPPPSTPAPSPTVKPAETPAPTPTPVPTPEPTPTPEPVWGAWSEWSTQEVTASPTREVEVGRKIIGFNMVMFRTMQVDSPHYRMFRDFGVSEAMDDFGASRYYGEECYTRYATAEQMQNATSYPPDGAFISITFDGELYDGYQMGTTTAYNFGDDKLFWFIRSKDEIPMYRYRDLGYN